MLILYLIVMKEFFVLHLKVKENVSWIYSSSIRIIKT